MGSGEVKVSGNTGAKENLGVNKEKEDFYFIWKASRTDDYYERERGLAQG